MLALVGREREEGIECLLDMLRLLDTVVPMECVDDMRRLCWEPEESSLLQLLDNVTLVKTCGRKCFCTLLVDRRGRLKGT